MPSTSIPSLFVLLGVVPFLAAHSIDLHDFTLGSPQNLLRRDERKTHAQNSVAENRDRPDYLERDDLTFTIQVVYAAARDSDLMGIRGNGLGFSVDATTPMTRVDRTTWSLQVVYKDTETGGTCPNSSPCESSILPGDDFVFRAVLTRDGEELDMRGYDYKLGYPQSGVSSALPEPEHPAYTVYPFFFSTSGEIVTLTVTSQDGVIGTRRMPVYLPPSVSENPAPEYDLLVGIDFGPDLMPLYFKPVLDYEFGESRRAKEAVVIGHGDFDPVGIADRTTMLTPTEELYYDCAEGSFIDACNGCLPADATPEEMLNLLLFGGCGRMEIMGGKADASLDYVMSETFPLADELLRERGSSLTRRRERTMIFGYSLGGLIACHALWTRPEVFGIGACQSPSLWWPMHYDFDAETFGSDWDFLNITLPAFADEDRPPQYILMDGGSLEEDEYFHMMIAPKVAYDFMSRLSVFEPEKNLFYNAYPGQSHGFVEWIARMWSSLHIMSIGRSDP